MNAFERDLQDARLRRIETKLDEILRELRERPQEPFVAPPGLQPQPWCCGNCIVCPYRTIVT